jgi:hypothetical protein
VLQALAVDTLDLQFSSCANFQAASLQELYWHDDDHAAAIDDERDLLVAINRPLSHVKPMQIPLLLDGLDEDF